VAPWHQIHPIPRGWLSENILAARLGEDFSLDIPFHRTGFVESAVNQVMSKRMTIKQQMQSRCFQSSATHRSRRLPSRSTRKCVEWLTVS